MSKQPPNVQKLDVQPFGHGPRRDHAGFEKLSIRKRTIKLNFWTGREVPTNDHHLGEIDGATAPAGATRSLGIGALP
jgi:hypothetical protein